MNSLKIIGNGQIHPQEYVTNNNLIYRYFDTCDNFKCIIHPFNHIHVIKSLSVYYFFLFKKIHSFSLTVASSFPLRLMSGIVILQM